MSNVNRKKLEVGMEKGTGVFSLGLLEKQPIPGF